jgi:hypothetical protein
MKGNKKGNKKPAKKGKSVRSLWRDVKNKKEEECQKDKAIKDLGRFAPQATVTLSLSPTPEANAPAAMSGPDPFGFNLDAIFKKIDTAIYGDSKVPAPKDASEAESKTGEPHFLDGVDLNDQVEMRDAVVGLFAKNKGFTVVQVGAPGFEMSLHDAVDAPFPKKNDKQKGDSGGVLFYWQYGEDNGNGEYFTITPKESFDALGGISDEHFDESALPPGFDCLMESTFSFDGTREAGEALLRANPIFEEKEMFPK